MSTASRPSSTFQPIDIVTPDIQFDVTRRFLADPNEDKINLGQGAYRDENGLPWVLPSVQMAKSSLGDINHEYLPIAGFQPFVIEATKLLFDGTEALAEERVASCQSLSGTGALMLIGLTLKKLSAAPDTIYITDPSWVNHHLMFTTIGFKVEQIPYFKNGGFDFDSYISTLKTAIPGSPILLHTCAHNPTGCDPTRDQWMTIGSIIEERGLFPIFDSAYLGFNSGSFSEDAWPIRYFLEHLNVELAVCLSMAKNMGLYGERIGLVTCALSSSSAAKVAQSVLQNVQRATITAPPAYGARVAAAVLRTSSIREQWSKDLVVMSSRIRKMRKRVYKELQLLQTPGDWSHIVRQTGMFAYLGISKTQVKHLEENFHVYMVETSRVSVAGLNDHNVKRFAWALDQTVRSIQ
ncbi:aspartate aminotransferase [Penicillium mononematosum]|uniref:aspartate aminotransferase n=1 Tax=Penicillium mononematosum TaxID=268346 RepID=UPI0025493D84|nr:aspartate aminotransferase [Penicillium mononematosum]KAJ6178233.1 aspartate aminotransferase [Penicillium mononematosum]